MSARERIAERAFDVMLYAYPREFRARHAREMRQLFHDRRRFGEEGGARFWTEMLMDVARSAPALRWEAHRIVDRPHHYFREGTMRSMAILTVLVGVIQIANAMAEALAGRSQLGDGYSLMGVALGVLAAVLLVAAGVALLRRGSGAATWARIAAVACVAVVVLIRVVQPWMSGFSTLLGIGFPIALLLFLFVTKRGKPSMPLST